MAAKRSRVRASATMPSWFQRSHFEQDMALFHGLISRPSYRWDPNANLEPHRKHRSSMWCASLPFAKPSTARDSSFRWQSRGSSGADEAATVSKSIAFRAALRS